MIKLIDILKEINNTIQYNNPNFSKEWMEAKRYPEFKEMGKQKWIELAQQGSITKLSKIKSVLGNVELDFDSLETEKKERFEKAFEKGVVEMPIAVKFGGYVYCTLDTTTGKQYIGKKAFFHKQNKKLGKKELATLPVARGKKPSKKLVISESDWKTYYGSSLEVKKLPKENLKRYVYKLCKTSKQLTYWETKYLFQYNVLEDDRYLNDNILGKFFRKDLFEAE